MRLLAIVALGVLAGASAASAQTAAASRPNILLIIADDLGYGDLSSYGAPDIKTPNLDRLAREGLRLTDYYANAPVCTPTRAALISGRYQQRFMLERPLSTTKASGHLDVGLPVTGRSLPQLMKNAGYATALIGKWHLGFRPEFSPNAHGFDYFFGYKAGYIDWYTHVRGDGEADVWENDQRVTVDGYFDHETIRRAEKYIGDHARSPFFLEVALGAPHWPFQSPHHASVAVIHDGSMYQQPADPNPPTRAEYAAIVEDADAGIGRLLATLDQSGAARNTLVIFISDNGGEWLSRNDPYFHRKDSIWEGGIRVPAVMRWPAQLPAGRLSSQMTITMDLTRTILGIAGADLTGTRLEGVDLLPQFKGTLPAIDRTFFWRVFEQRAVRSGPWKFVSDGGQQFLFDVTKDPGERHDEARLHPEIVVKLKAQLEAWEKDVDTEAAAMKGRHP